MSAGASLQLAFFGDDFTGSTDALEQLSRAGLKTLLYTRLPTPAMLEQAGVVDAIGVAGHTRSLDPAAMEAVLRPAFAALQALHPRHLHYKVCSTFDSSPTVGSIGRALEVGLEVCGSTFAPVVVGAPALGRYCAFGNLFARMGIGSKGSIHRLDRHPSMSRHPVTPADEADLRLHLARQTPLPTGLVDCTALDGGENQCIEILDTVVAKGARAVFFDTVHDSHVRRIGSLLERHATGSAPLFSVGSSGIEMALGAHWTARGLFRERTDWIQPGPAAPLLVLSGSCSPVTSRQIDWAEAQGFTVIEVDPAGLAAGGQTSSTPAVQQAVAALRAGRHTVISSCRGKLDTRIDSPTTRAALGRGLGSLGRTLLEEAPVARLLIAGGDTSSHAATALGIEALEMVAPLLRGAPLCRAHASRSPAQGLEVVFKGGQVGPDDFFALVAAGS